LGADNLPHCTLRYVSVALAVIASCALSGCRDQTSHTFPLGPSPGHRFPGVILPAAIHAKAVHGGNGIIIPCGTYEITAPIAITAKGFHVRGENKTCVVITVGARFRSTSAGVITFPPHVEPGPVVSDLTIHFVQPEVASRDHMIRYPPAIYAQSSPRFRLERVRIELAWNGIDMKGVGGGATILDLEMSAFNIGIDIDNAVDTIRITNLHFWPFGFGPLDPSIMGQPGVIGVNVGRADGVQISNSMTFAATGLRVYKSANGIAGLMISNFNFDTFGGIVMDAGWVSCTSCFFSAQRNTDTHVLMTGGTLMLTAAVFLKGAPGPVPGVSLAGPGSIAIFNSAIENDGGDLPFLLTQADTQNQSLATGGSVILTGNHFHKVGDMHYTLPVVGFFGHNPPRFTVTANTINDKGAGTGIFFHTDDAQWGELANNVLLGYALSLPTSRERINISGNMATPIVQH
jgi:hypothetical protein